MSEAAPTASPASADMVEMTAEVVSAYVVKNSVPLVDLPGLIASVHGALVGLGSPASAATEAPKPVAPVSVKKSIEDDFIVSMEDGKRYKSLKRHLAKHGLTPAEYRAKWGLPVDYPMVSPAYSAARSALAKSMGLGAQRRKG